MAMGPLRVFDLAGLDIGYKARQALPDDRKGDPMTYRVPDRLVEAGRLGQKSGAGFYTYDENRRPLVDPAVQDIIEEAAIEFGVARREIEDEEIVRRLVGALVDEGRRILEEGIAQRAGDIDIVYVYGYGFPAWRGGPMHYGDTAGL
jgi:3-hydroxyacyl-CoA dehydrogenase